MKVRKIVERLEWMDSVITPLDDKFHEIIEEAVRTIKCQDERIFAMQEENQGLEEELKPCPFCGGEALYLYSKGNGAMSNTKTNIYYASYRGTICCEKCRMQLHEFAKMSDAVKAWNRRTHKVGLGVEHDESFVEWPKKCPCCGSDVDIVQKKGIPSGIRIECKDREHCGLSQLWFKTEEKAIKAWNNRTQ